MSGPSFTIDLKCASCNSDIGVSHYVVDGLERRLATFFLVTHRCPPEMDPFVCDLTKGCRRPGVPLDDTTHMLAAHSEDAPGVMLMSLSFHPECCPHWLAGNPCDKRH